ncbi:protein Diedel-like [Drosophila pseudoobscura]|uniref:Protein Diedel-like n=1 Tax=Drosophila pseudoobscura pseudoobscura TaxID=46245 RepID=A0A6I8VQ54_DROPS|nr:protein Diedel-like [Drosophila pseudoobscura]
MRFLIVLSAMMACTLLLWLPPLAMAVCCRPTRIRFAVMPSIEERNCNTYGGVPDKRQKTCKAAICNNGQPVAGQWCGIGKCNATGCRCKNGCIKPRSDAVRTFLDKNGHSKFVFVRRAPAIVDN